MSVGRRSGWRGQLRALRSTALLVHVPTLVFLLILFVQTRYSLDNLMRDPLSTMKAPFHTGVISNLGVLVWFSSAPVCLFSAVVVRKTGGDVVRTRFFLSAGLLTAMLAADDLFMLHESAGWRLQIPELAIYAGYALLICAFLVSFRPYILQTDYVLLLIALGFFGTQVIVDPPEFQARYSEKVGRILEDGGKLLGIVTWTVYFMRTCTRELTRALVPGERAQA